MELGFGLYKFRENGKSLVSAYFQKLGRIIDAAPNYFNGAAHALIAKSVQSDAKLGEIKIWSKVGFSPNPDSRRRQIGAGIITLEELVGNHALNPRLIRHQISEAQKELLNLKLDAIYLHNPEHQLRRLSRRSFWDLMKECVLELETACANGYLRRWGVSTWSGLERHNGAPPSFSVSDWEEVAQNVAGTLNHFKLVQTPLNLARLNVLADFLRHDSGLIQEASHLGKILVASSPMGGGMLPPVLTKDFRRIFGDSVSSGQVCILFLAAIQQISVCLISPRNEDQLNDSMATATMPILSREELCRLIHCLISS